jgi:hypothetical protein
MFQPMTKEFTWYMACREKMDSQRKGDPVGYAYRNGDFFALGRSDCFTLWWFKPGKTDPITIPLHFTIDDAILADMKQRFGAVNASEVIPHMNAMPMMTTMTVTSEGLCVNSEWGGFWFIPFGDIDSYLASHGAGSP